MKREIIGLLAAALMLTGCGRNTTVYIPEKKTETAAADIVVQIPVKPTEETESRPEETEAQTEPAPTETVPTEPAPTEPVKTPPSGNRPSGNSNKGNSGNKNNGSAKPEETSPPATEMPATEPVPTQPPLYDISGYVVGALEYELLSKINEFRQAEGLEGWYLDAYLSAVASCRSYEISQLWSHTRPDGRSFETVLTDYGYFGTAAGELLGYSTGDAAAIAEKWIASDSHRAMLAGSSSGVGIGIYSLDGVIYVTAIPVA